MMDRQIAVQLENNDGRLIHANRDLAWYNLVLVRSSVVETNIGVFFLEINTTLKEITG